MRRGRLGIFVAAGLLLAAALAFFVGPQASSQPDGLDKVAIEKGFDHHERAHGLHGSPTAGYSLRGVGDDRLATGLAGLIGVGATFLLAAGLAVAVRRAGRGRADHPATGEPAG